MMFGKMFLRKYSKDIIIKYNNPIYYIEKSFDIHKKSVDQMLGYTVGFFALSISGLAGTMLILKDDIDKKFDKIDKKFDNIDKKIDKIDKKFDNIDKKFDNIERILNEINSKK